MNVRHPMGVLHSFSVKNISCDKMDLRLFYFDVAKYFSVCYFVIPVKLESPSDTNFIDVAIQQLNCIILKKSPLLN